MTLGAPEPGSDLLGEIAMSKATARAVSTGVLGGSSCVVLLARQGLLLGGPDRVGRARRGGRRHGGPQEGHRRVCPRRRACLGRTPHDPSHRRRVRQLALDAANRCCGWR